MTRSRPARLIAVLIAALIAALALTACGSPAGSPAGRPAPTVDDALRAMLPEDVRSAGVLTFATEPSYPPASSFAADGRTIVGFEPDLAEGVGALLGLRVRFQAESFDTLLDGLVEQRYDAVMSAMTDTTERQERADFVNYFRAGSAVVVQRGNPHGILDLEDLCGHVVAVESGTVHVDLLERGHHGCAGEPIEIVRSASNDAALLELRTGRAAAVITDYPPAVFATTDERTQAAFQLASDVQYEPGLYGIAVSRERSGLRDAIAAALDRLVESGEYQHVLDAWGVSSGTVDSVTVNGRQP